MAYAGGAGGAEQSSQAYAPAPAPGPPPDAQSGPTSSHSPQSNAPTKVLHVKGLADHIGQADVETYFGQFGGVALTMMMRQPGTVLVEMATLEQAQTVISYGQSMPLKLGGQLLKIDFSRSQAINRAAAARAAGNAAPPAGHPPPTSSQPPPPHTAAHMPPHTMPPASGPAYGAAGGGPPPPASNAILHFTVRNAVHPLTVHTLQQLFAPHGQVLRMVMFYKNTLQGFVEFADTQAAGAAKAALSGQDIYDGCCHLSVQEARNHGPLNVRGANDHNVDFTNPTLAPQPLRGLDPEQIA
ncbi:Hnrnpll, partial [Symbiodinium sp. KB8]